jgi:aromatic-amino-acid transaminase
LYVLAKDAAELGSILSNGHALARAAWSMPPDHGAAAVRLVLSNPKLTDEWLDELAQMRARIRQVRATLARAGKVGKVDLAPLGRQNGMFATLALTKDQIEALRKDHGIYMAGSGRINVAGLTMDNIAKFTSALAELAAAPADAA